MSKVLILLLALLAFASASFLRTHDYWYTAQKSLVKTGAPFSDIAWNYCDLKCLYLERYYTTADFAFITFNAGTFKPNFGACYVIKTDSNGAKTYALWNTVATNTWYDTNCGKETEDYYAFSTGASPKYKVEQIEGEGKGVEVTY
jgi:hypothetical protein